VRLRLRTAAANGSIVHPPGYMSMESHGGMILTGKEDELGEKPVPEPLFPPHGLTRVRTRVSAVTGRRLTVRAMARLFRTLLLMWQRRFIRTDAPTVLIWQGYVYI
jgi:hypothetical protein